MCFLFKQYSSGEGHSQVVLDHGVSVRLRPEELLLGSSLPVDNIATHKIWGAIHKTMLGGVFFEVLFTWKVTRGFFHGKATQFLSH